MKKEINEREMLLDAAFQAYEIERRIILAAHETRMDALWRDYETECKRIKSIYLGPQ